MTIKKSDFLLNFMMFCLGATVGRRIGDPYLLRHLAAKSADLMLVNLPYWIYFSYCLIAESQPRIQRTVLFVNLSSSLPVETLVAVDQRSTGLLSTRS
jgi:hypothetical protein